jgi:hypothetical protein
MRDGDGTSILFRFAESVVNIAHVPKDVCITPESRHRSATLPIAISRSLFVARDGDRVRLITRNGRLVALFGRHGRTQECLLLGEERKS